jgi:hypothetical protein
MYENSYNWLNPEKNINNQNLQSWDHLGFLMQKTETKKSRASVSLRNIC